MQLPLLALQDISLTFGAVPLLSGAALTWRPASLEAIAGQRSTFTVERARLKEFYAKRGSSEGQTVGRAEAASVPPSSAR